MFQSYFASTILRKTLESYQLQKIHTTEIIYLSKVNNTSGIDFGHYHSFTAISSLGSNLEEIHIFLYAINGSYKIKIYHLQFYHLQLAALDN